MPHDPVLVEEVCSLLALKRGATVVDGTLGGGGHSEAILQQVGPQGVLIGFDQDQDAIQRASKRLQSYGPQVHLRHLNFKEMGTALAGLKVSAVDAVLLDIGFSSDQLEDAGRGFSFQQAGPLDMRMNRDEEVTAADLIRILSEEELSDIFRSYGEERRARQLAKRIVNIRQRTPITTTVQLAKLVEDAVPPQERFRRIHPATRVFQALRIAVNQELEALRTGIDAGIAALKPGGRLAVITFHSLEDRIVKQKFQTAMKAGKIRLVTRKPVQPSAEEIQRNSRARSAKLRVAEKAESYDRSIVGVG